MRDSDRMLADARPLVGSADVLSAEMWASDWLGRVWASAEMGDRAPEHMLIMEVVGRACSRPSPHGLAAVAALHRVAPNDDLSMLAETIAILAESQPMPPWPDASPWTAVEAWQAMDVWESERALRIEYAGPQPHTVMAAISEVGGTMLQRLALLDTGAADLWDPGDGVPMPIAEIPLADALTDLAWALKKNDMYWPRITDPNVVSLRSLVLARLRGVEIAWPDDDPMSDKERAALVAEFIASSGLPDDDTVRSLFAQFIFFGEGYLTRGPFAWSPGEVERFLTDWLPRKAILEAEERERLPETLRAWIRFALERRNVDGAWIDPVVDAVDEHLAEFHNAFSDDRSWGPAKQFADALLARGIDMDDKEAVERAMREVNAERLARRLTED